MTTREWGYYLVQKGGVTQIGLWIKPLWYLHGTRDTFADDFWDEIGAAVWVPSLPPVSGDELATAVAERQACYDHAEAITRWLAAVQHPEMPR